MHRPGEAEAAADSVVAVVVFMARACVGVDSVAAEFSAPAFAEAAHARLLAIEAFAMPE
jgi:hypothetical protein